MYNLTGVGTLLAIIGYVAFIDPGVADAQIEGAVQYPPLSIGEDAQPPPPARMVPKIVSPRRLELGASWSSSSLAPRDPRYPEGADRLLMQRAPLDGTSPPLFPTGRGND